MKAKQKKQSKAIQSVKSIVWYFIQGFVIAFYSLWIFRTLHGEGLIELLGVFLFVAFIAIIFDISFWFVLKRYVLKRPVSDILGETT